MTVKVAIVGAGAMGREHIRAFAASADVSIAGIVSRTRARAETLAQEQQISLVCSSISELYERTRADLVVIAVPELEARRVSEACFAYPWAVLMEKPAGYNLADAEAIQNAARQKSRRIWVGLNRRFLSSTQAVLRDLETNPGPRFIHVQDQQSLEMAAAIGHPKEVIANWMFANSIHVIDYLTCLGRGGVRMIRRVWPWQAEHTSTVLATVDFHSGDRGLYEGIWRGPGPWAVTVNTPQRRWELRPLEQAAFQNAGERRLQTVEMHEWDRQFKPGFRLHAEEIIKAMKGEPSQAVTIDQAMETMRLIAAIFRADG